MMNATPDPLFDRLVRLRLDQAQCLPDPNGWSRLEAALDSLDQQNAAFDVAIGQHLHTIDTPETDIPDFSAIEHALTDPFDAQIAARLRENEQVLPATAADWQAFEALLPHPFDQQLQHKLSDFSMPEQPADWSRIEAQLPTGFDEVVRERVAGATDAGQPVWYAFDAAYAATIAGEQLRGYEVAQRPDWPAFAQKLALAEGRASARWRSLVIRVSAIAAAVALLVVGGSQWLMPNLPVIVPMAAKKQLLPVAPLAADKQAIASEQHAAAHAIPAKDAAKTAALPPQAAPVSHFEDTYAGVRPLYEFEQIEAFEAEPLLKSGGLMTRASAVRKSAAHNQQVDMRLLQPLLAFGPSQQLAVTRSFGSQPAGVALPHTGFASVIWLGPSATAMVSAAELNSKGMLGQVAGLRMYVQLGAKWGVVAGLQYGHKQFEQTYLNLNPAGTALIATRTVGKMAMMEFPLMLRYDLGPINGPMKLYVQGGLAPAMTMREHFTTFQESQIEPMLPTIQEVATLQTYAGTLYFAPGVAMYPCRKQQVQIQAEPYLQIGLQPLSDARSKLSSAGITINVLYQMKH